MKKVSGLVMAIFMLIAFNIHAQGIKFFEGTIKELKTEAQKQNKLIFIDCYTTWCGPCKMLEKNIFPLKEVGDFYNSHFVCYELDMEKGEGLELAKQYNVTGYPTLLYLNASGETVHRAGGAGDAKKIITDGENAFSPTDNLVALQKSFKNGKRDTALLRKLIIGNRSAMLPEDPEAVDAYWKQVPPEDLLNISCLNVFIYCDISINSPQFNYLYANKEKFLAKFPKETIDYALYYKAANAIYKAGKSKDAKLFERAKAIVAETKDPQITQTAQFNEMEYYKDMGQWDNYLTASDKMAVYTKNNYQINNSIAWNIVSNTDDKKLLNKALEYATKSIEAKKEYANMDTYAFVLFKLGKMNEAHHAATEALELAKKEGNEDYASTKALLEKIDKASKK